MVKKTSKKKEIYDYVSGYIKSEDAEEIINCNDIFNDKGFNLWSFKKLILLEYYIKPYLAIILRRDFKCYFIDLFSGCGANEVEGMDLKSVGSPIVSLMKGVIPNIRRNRNNRFDKWFFIDSNEEYCKALESRVARTLEIIKTKFNEVLEINKDVKILCGNCNKKIIRVIEEIKKEARENKIAVLVFIDPYEFTEIEWGTWEKLLSLRYTDIIFTFPISTINRGIDLCKDKEKYLPPSFIELLKKMHISDIGEDKFGELYARDIVNLVKRSINHYEKGIRVTNTKNAELYRIELFTHSQAAVRITLDIARKLDNISPFDLKSIVESVCGKTKTLGDFC